MDGQLFAAWTSAAAMIVVNIGTVCYFAGKLAESVAQARRETALAHERINELEATIEATHRAPCKELLELKDSLNRIYSTILERIGVISANIAAIKTRIEGRIPDQPREQGGI